MRITFAALICLFSQFAYAHGGGLNKDGCHYNRRTGDYHCHRGPAASTTPTSRFRQSSLNRARQYQDEANALIQRNYQKTKRASRNLIQSAVYFANCSEARAAGFSRIRRGSPGYASHLDRDGDGVACE